MADLVARVPVDARTVVDLGSGPGHLTPLLHARWPDAAITGIDASPAMVAPARRDASAPSVRYALAGVRSWALRSSSSPCVKWWPSGETQSRIGTGPMRACDHSANPVSPCSPTMSACTLVAATRALSAMRRRSREVSSTVPDEHWR